MKNELCLQRAYRNEDRMMTNFFYDFIRTNFWRGTNVCMGATTSKEHNTRKFETKIYLAGGSAKRYSILIDTQDDVTTDICTNRCCISVAKY
jgi:hypothetical protein